MLLVPSLMLAIRVLLVKEVTAKLAAAGLAKVLTTIKKHVQTIESLRQKVA